MIAEFSDATVTKIIGIFSSLQPVEYVPFQAEIFADDPRYELWWESLPEGTITGDLPDPTNGGQPAIA